MTRINTNVSALIAQQNLATANTQLQTALTRLSTGLQINSGADNPAGLIAAASLGSDITGVQTGINKPTIHQLTDVLTDVAPLDRERGHGDAVVVAHGHPLDLREVSEPADPHAAGGVAVDQRQHLGGAEVVAVEFLAVERELLGHIDSGADREDAGDVFISDLFLQQAFALALIEFFL